MNIKTLNHKTYIVETPGVQFFGNREQIRQRLLDLDFDLEEIEMGFDELTKNDHNIAHFGIAGRFIFSKKKAA